jgi:hypothetical protein
MNKRRFLTASVVAFGLLASSSVAYIGQAQMVASQAVDLVARQHDGRQVDGSADARQNRNDGRQVDGSADARQNRNDGHQADGSADARQNRNDGRHADDSTEA